jgi:hypothetical protein
MDYKFRVGVLVVCFLVCFITLLNGSWAFLSHDEFRLVDGVRIAVGGFGSPFILAVLRKQISFYKKR